MAAPDYLRSAQRPAVLLPWQLRDRREYQPSAKRAEVSVPVDPIHEFQNAVLGTIGMLFLAGVARLVRPLHVPYLVNGWNPFGRKFDEAAALKQNRFTVRLALGGAGLSVVYGVGALVVGLVQSLT